VALRDLVKNPWGRREPPSPTLVSALADLDRLTVERPELAPAGRSLAAVLAAVFSGPIPQLKMQAEPDLIVAAWKRGVPAFRAGESPLEFDRDDLRARALALLEVLRLDNPKAVVFLDKIRRRAVDLASWASDALADEFDALEETSRATGLDASLARAVIRLSLLPILARLSDQFATIRPEGIWDRGVCPNCGSPPILVESRGLEQARWLRCGLCAADWPGQRLRCPFCDETDHRRLHYRFAEGEQDRYRLGLCDSCDGSLVVVSTLRPLSAPGLLIAELATVHLRS
jgi:formate dehydrogenase maturation protein FdhE